MIERILSSKTGILIISSERGFAGTAETSPGVCVLFGTQDGLDLTNGNVFKHFEKDLQHN